MFVLSEEQQMFQDVMRSYMTKEIQPNVYDLENGKVSCFDLTRKMMDILGIGAMLKPGLEKIAKKREQGGNMTGSLEKILSGGQGEGPGNDPMIMMILLKEISRVSPGMAMSFGVSLGLVGGAILSKGTASQIRKYAIPVLLQEKIGSWCLTEPGSGSDAFGSMKTVAKKKGDKYILNGSKTFITNGPIADIFLIYAKIDNGQPPKDRPIHTFIVEKGMKGFSTGSAFEKMGMKESPTCEVFMDDVELEKKDILGEIEHNQGRKTTKESLGSERSSIPGMCLGIIERCYEECLQYAKTREQFGHPIGEFQAVQLKIARMYIHYKNVENIVFRLVWMQQSNIRDLSFINSSKVYASQAAVEVANDAIQIFGGYGYMREYPVEKMYRDAKLLELGAGTTDINAMTAARNELGML
jgi:alkylation response protein AidB-like acyl-CoA dehydrogenase